MTSEKMKRLRELSRSGYSICTISLAEEILRENSDEISLKEKLAVKEKLGIALVSVDRFSDAVELLNEVLASTEEQSYSALVAMGFIVYQCGKYAEAVEWFAKAFEQESPRVIAMDIYTTCLIKQERYADVIEILEDRDYKEETAFYNQLGAAYRALGKYDDALANFQKVVELDDQDEASVEAVEDLLLMKKGGYGFAN